MNVPSLSLLGKSQASTYARVVQVTGSTLYDGVGNSIDFLNATASNAVNSIFAETASFSVITQVTQSNTTSSLTSESSSWASQSLSSSWSPPQLGAVTVIHHDGTITIYNPDSDTDLARGYALITASNNVVDRDVIYLANATYDISSSDNIDLSNNKKLFGVSLVGSGKYSTQIKSTWNNVDNFGSVIIQLGNASIVSDLSIIGYASSSLYQLPIGTYSTVFSQSIIRNIYINVSSDGIYLNSGNNNSLTAYNVTCDTVFDCVNIGGNFFTGSFYDCVFNTQHASTNPFPGTQLRAVVLHAGATSVLNMFNCKMTVNENSGGASAYGLFQTSGTTNIYGGSIYTSGSTNVFDISNGGGTVGVTSNLVYNPAKVNGTLTYLDTQQIQASISSSVTSSISSSYSRTASTASLATSASWAAGLNAYINAFPDGTFTYNGTLYKPVGSTTCGIQEAINMLPIAPNYQTPGGGTIRLAPGIFYTSQSIVMPNTRYPFGLQLFGSGITVGGIVMTGSAASASGSVIDFGNGNFGALTGSCNDKSFHIKDMFVASAFNTTSSILSINGAGSSISSASIATVLIEHCWFGWWQAMITQDSNITNQGGVLTPSVNDDAAYFGPVKHNLVGITIDCNFNNDTIIRDCEFTFLAVGLAAAGDHMVIKDNVFSFCGRIHGVDNDWPWTTPKRIGCGILIQESTANTPGNPFYNGNDNWRIDGNNFIGSDRSSSAYIFNTGFQRPRISYNDSFEYGGGGCGLVAIADNSFSASWHGTWTFVNPSPSGNLLGLPSYKMPSTTDFSTWDHQPLSPTFSSSLVRTWDMQWDDSYDGPFTFSGSITALHLSGSLFGTSSWANQTISSSFAKNALTAAVVPVTSVGDNTFYTPVLTLGSATQPFDVAGGTTSQIGFNPSSGVLNVGGPITSVSITSSLQGTSSWATTASFALNVSVPPTYTSSLFGTASWANKSVVAITSSWASQSFAAVSASWASHSINSDASTSSSFASRSFAAVSSSWASASFSSSYAITASYASNAGTSAPVDVWPLVKSSAQTHSVDFNVPYLEISGSISGAADLCFTSSANIQAVKNAVIYVSASLDRNIVWSNEWQYLTLTPPSNITSTEALIASFTALGPNNTDIIASVALTV